MEDSRHSPNPHDASNEPGIDHSEPRTIVVPRDIISLVESYFSDAHLARNKFIRNLIREHHGALPVRLVAAQKKVEERIHGDLDYVRASADASDKLTLCEEQDVIVRRAPLPHTFDIAKFTPLMIYVERIAETATVDVLQKQFSIFGSIDYVDLPRYTQTGKVKGFAFVQFETVEPANWAISYFQGELSRVPTNILRKAEDLRLPNYSVTSKKQWLSDKSEYRSVKRKLNHAVDDTGNNGSYRSVFFHTPASVHLALCRTYAEMAGEVQHVFPINRMDSQESEQAESRKVYQVQYKYPDSVDYADYIFREFPILVHGSSISVAQISKPKKAAPSVQRKRQRDEIEDKPSAECNESTKRPAHLLKEKKDDASGLIVVEGRRRSARLAKSSTSENGDQSTSAASDGQKKSSSGRKQPARKKPK
eukprot:gb/GECG01016013.1/.p1 GENE.gb/GECG01016013.1/~~gb/GECG01016013.1/.p1  ORF type:complete len:421 (+),score=48.52 gb/GECG01016013.1/:1-1263(+)